jgi:raffinose/stachyose/melibiose transport system substrate-binding protein
MSRFVVASLCLVMIACEPPKEPVSLSMAWWGEQEAPGARAWLEQTITMYKELQPHVTITHELRDTDGPNGLLERIAENEASQSGPDIQYFWGGVWTIEHVWKDSLVAVDDLIPIAERARWISNSERVFEGKTWGVPWYLSGNPVAYNKEILAAAGVTAPITTWAQLLDACADIRAAGYTPIGGGLSDGWFGGWIFNTLARQTLASERTLMNAVVGDASLATSPHTEWWQALKESIDAECWNADILDIGFQDGQDLFKNGEAAMVIGNDTFIAGWAQSLGWEKIGVMLPPKFGSAAMANTYSVTAQGLGIPAWSPHPQEAADFLVFMHTPERLSAWFQATGVLPADNRLDTAVLTQLPMQQIYDWDTSVAGPNLENFIPSAVDAESNFVSVPALFAGTKTPLQAGQDAEAAAANWRSTEPTQLANFQLWMQ